MAGILLFRSFETEIRRGSILAPTRLPALGPLRMFTGTFLRVLRSCPGPRSSLHSHTAFGDFADVGALTAFLVPRQIEGLFPLLNPHGLVPPRFTRL